MTQQRDLKWTLGCIQRGCECKARQCGAFCKACDARAMRYRLARVEAPRTDPNHPRWSHWDEMAQHLLEGSSVPECQPMVIGEVVNPGEGTRNSLCPVLQVFVSAIDFVTSRSRFMGSNWIGHLARFRRRSTCHTATCQRGTRHSSCLGYPPRNPPSRCTPISPETKNAPRSCRLAPSGEACVRFVEVDRARSASVP